jgi:CheY-like chemotaxis protein
MSQDRKHVVVLVVDDDFDLRTLLVDILEQEGYRAVPAAHGGKALELLRDGLRPSLILLDMMMPVMDGWTFRAEQRDDPTLSDIPVVVFSAYTDVTATARELDAAAGLAKPLRLEDLLGVIEDLAKPADPSRPQA